MCASSGGPTGHESSAGQKAKRLPGPIFTANLKQIANHAATSHLPSIYNVRDFAEAGGLVTYGQIASTCSGVPPSIWTRFSKARSPAIFPSSSRRSSNW